MVVALIIFAGWSSKGDNLERFLQSLPADFRVLPENSEVSPVEGQKTITVGKEEFRVDVASTQEQRKIGLSEHTELADGHGMLFVFDEPSRPAFWMKGMNFPIDIVWIADLRVVQITSSVPTLVRDAQGEQVPTYSPNQPINYVLEISAGEARRKNIKVGDEVKIE